jgi:cytochrome b
VRAHVAGLAAAALRANAARAGGLRAVLRAGLERDEAAHERHLGHNPLGALMVFALLLVSALLVASGTVALGGLYKQGPLRAFVSSAFAGDVYALHQPLAVVLLVLVGVHVLGVGFESLRGRESLVRAMVTGRKPRMPAAVAARAARPHKLAAAGLGAALLLAGGFGIAALAALPGRGVPPAGLDPVYAEQCGACHLAYSPSLAPASTWRGILADLQHHFGQDATLSAAQVAHIRAYLIANSAEHWDSYPARMMLRPAANGSRRLTDAPGWQRMHRGIPEAVFRSKAVYRRSACDACHTDAASGRFAPQRIVMPEGSGS